MSLIYLIYCPDCTVVWQNLLEEDQIFTVRPFNVSRKIIGIGVLLESDLWVFNQVIPDVWPVLVNILQSHDGGMVAHHGTRSIQSM